MINMDIITQLCKLDLFSLFTGFFLILSAIITGCTIIGRFSEMIGRPVKWVREKDNDLKRLTEMFVEKQIDDMRYEILNFASSLSEGREFNKEQFDHILQIHQKYEEILKKHDMTNGQVVMSMEVINEIYKEKLKHGFQSQKGAFP